MNHLDQIRRELSPSGVIRVAVNLANTLLVSRVDASGTPVGIVPDIAADVASKLSVEVDFVKFAWPAELAEAADQNVWDICFIAEEPARATKIAFSCPYAEIPATYLVRSRAPFVTPSDVDQVATRIAVARGSAYDLWLSRHIQSAKLVRAASIEGAVQLFIDENLEALAGLRAHLLLQEIAIPQTRVLASAFSSVRQAIGTPPRNTATLSFLNSYARWAVESGLIQDLIERHGIRGVELASPRNEPR
jgi:polar amino acid transport system substrate-binding protein